MDVDIDEEYGYLDDYQDVDEPQHHFLEGHTALKFLFAGGIAGAGTLLAFCTLLRE
jgi:solute carrier family 25 phosphate transporter 23/24/25/41